MRLSQTNQTSRLPRFRLLQILENNLFAPAISPLPRPAQEEFHATQEYVDIVKPNVGADDQVTALPGA